MQLGIVDGETIGSKLVPARIQPRGAPRPGAAPRLHLSFRRPGIDHGYLGGNARLVTIWDLPICAPMARRLALTFVNATVGQRIAIVIKQASTSTATTVTLSTGTIVAGTAGATQALTNTNSVIDIIHVTCTAPGVYIASFN